MHILYSFRRCPYAIRGRMALYVAGIEYEHREVVLKNKPAEMLALSPKGTVPVLHLENGVVIEESLEIMQWALEQHEPKLLSVQGELQRLTERFITRNDGPFKYHLDRYKYAARYPGIDVKGERDSAVCHLGEHEQRLLMNNNLLGEQPSLADVATFPFVRQFSKVEPLWFTEALPGTHRWLQRWENSSTFKAVMHKHSPWSSVLG